MVAVDMVTAMSIRGGCGLHNTILLQDRGEVMWSFECQKPIFSSPCAIPGGGVAVGCVDGCVYMIDSEGHLVSHVIDSEGHLLLHLVLRWLHITHQDPCSRHAAALLIIPCHLAEVLPPNHVTIR